MADIAQRAEMRRRRILMNSEERMKKVLGPSAIEAKSSSVPTPVIEDLQPIQTKCNRPDLKPYSSSNTVSSKLQDHTFQLMKSKKTRRVTVQKPWISDIMVFPIGMITRAFPSYFVPILILVTLLILVETSSCPTIGFWATMLCGSFGIDHRRSFGVKVLSLLEKAFGVFLMFSFSFISAEALVLWST